MKSIRNIAFTALLTLGAFSAITYTSCNKDECKDVVCQNGGSCLEGTCSCATGYEGTNCETLSRTKFIGTWTGTDECGTDSYNITLTVGTATNAVSALVTNIGGYGTNITVTGNVTANNKISFTTVSVGGGRTLTGTMTFSGNSMTFDYTVTESGGDVTSCDGTYTKQS